MAYRWDGDHLVGQQQYLADGTVAREVQWVYEPGSFRPLAQMEDKGDVTRLHYIITDLAGTARELCSEEGEVHWRGEQGLWGAHREERRPIPLRRYLGDAANEEVYCELRYQGQLYDAETGLYYNRHRYYDAESGQYISPDPIGLNGGVRPQGYVNNPLEWVDPLGLEKKGPAKAYSTAYEMKLSKESYPGVSRARHFQEANESLLKAMESDKGLAKSMNELGVNLERTPTGLAPRRPPENWTWHHEVDEGVMRLVPRSQHTPGSQYWQVLHPNGHGGYAVWGK